MLLDSFNYNLPKELIARYPSKTRSESRLLQVSDSCYHRVFNELPELIDPNDLLIFNNSRVIPARLFAQKLTGGKIEILIERLLTERTAIAHIKSNKSIKLDSQLVLLDKSSNKLLDHINVQVTERQDELFTLTFSQAIMPILNQHGHIPLPPYLNRDDEKIDNERYQTIYAQHDGSVAAPTAGLHFDDAVLTNIKDKGIAMDFVTLHVGAGTFSPVRCQDPRQHRMHKEWIEVSQQVCDKITATKARGGRIIAVGTTTVRCLETANNKPYCGETDIFILPGYTFNTVDILLTNFHLPCSSLLMLVCAFAGYERTMNAYQTAIDHQYRFYSYGDAMLVSKASP
ncbi:MAG: tRNA preQ1(34) S-adenosylmethionine ribosyltransferase-isomerase QueA [Pseudomonadota bacterium]